jgi:predicted ATP-dependent serine protease
MEKLTSEEIKKKIKEDLLKKEQVIKCFANVQKKELKWLWNGKIPIGYLTLLIGDAGLGKSFVTCDITSRLSNGISFPFDSQVLEPQKILFQNLEDDPEQITIYRLEDSGADVNNVFYIDSSIENGLDLSDINNLIDKIIEIQPKLIVIDPLTSYMNGTDIDKYKQVYDILTPLSLIARYFEIAIIGVMHMNKSNTKALYKTMGSAGFASAARVVLGITRNPDNEKQRLLCPIKGNYSSEQNLKEYVFEITDKGIAWLEEREPLNIDGLFTYDNDSTTINAKQWLVDYLSSINNHTAPMKEILDNADISGFERLSIEKARKIVCKKPFQKNKCWNWELKEEYIRDSEIRSSD